MDSESIKVKFDIVELGFDLLKLAILSLLGCLELGFLKSQAFRVPFDKS